MKLKKIVLQKLNNVKNNKDESNEKRLACLLFIQMNRINNKEYTRRLKNIYNSDSIQGALAVAFFFNLMAMQIDTPKDRIFFLNEMKKCYDDVNNMKKIKKGWMEYNMHPWYVVHHKPEKQIARYNSEPIIKYYSKS